MRVRWPRGSERWLMAAVVLTLALLMGAASSAAAPRAPATLGQAQALTHPASRQPTIDTVQIGPIHAGRGFILYLTAVGCGSQSPYFTATFITGTAPDVLSHTYTGADATCSTSRSSAGAQLTASLPRTIDIDAHIDDVGAALPRPGLPAGCGPPFGPELPATATGRIDVAIHTPVFGRHNLSTAPAQIFPGAPQHCPEVQSTRGRELTADVGPYVISAAAPTHGSPQLNISDAFGDSSPSGLIGVLALELGGTRAYDVMSSTGDARLSAVGPLASGRLSFSPLAACPGYRGENGTLTGTLAIIDPLLGKQAINGANTQVAFSGLGRVTAGSCNGPGSEPVAADLVSSCDQANAACSVAAATSTATFFDETDAGTQTISAEAVSFGDGSAPVPITNYGSVTHTYAKPGVYMATLAVTDGTGVTSTATASVVIEP